MSEANVHVERPVGRYGKTKGCPAKYGRVVDVSGCGRYWKFEYGQTRRIARWFSADAIELHPVLANAELSGPRPLAAEGSRSNDVLEGGGQP